MMKKLVSIVLLSGVFMGPSPVKALAYSVIKIGTYDMKKVYQGARDYLKGRGISSTPVVEKRMEHYVFQVMAKLPQDYLFFLPGTTLPPIVPTDFTKEMQQAVKVLLEKNFHEFQK